MGYLPRQKAVKGEEKAAAAFGGCRFDGRAGLNSFAAMENLSSRAFPLLAPREGRSLAASLQGEGGSLFAREALCFADQGGFYYGGAFKGSLQPGEKRFAAMGAYVLIWPDKLCYDVEADSLFPLEHSRTSQGRAYFGLAREDGSPYDSYSVSETAPENPQDGELWLDSSQAIPSLKQYSAASAAWFAVAATYIRLGAEGIGRGFRRYDGVEISGVENPDLNGSFVLYGAEEDYVLIAGVLDMAFYQDTPLTVKRAIPDMDFIAEHENRLWGCSSARREIYACKLGDPANWNCFMGISTDSYALSVGIPGPFTGMASYGGNLLFFKEDCILKMLGTKPANFQLSLTRGRGVKLGSHKSLAQAEGLLFYHSPDGICAYGGAFPEKIDGDLGPARYRGAVAGALGSRYYVSMEDVDTGLPHLFAYDAALGLWHREDGCKALDFCRLGERLYFLSGRDIWAMGRGEPGDAAREGAVSWRLETGELCESGHFHPRRLRIRAEASAGARFRAALSYDGRPFEDAGGLAPGRKRPVELPLRLRRCDSLRLRLEGRGDMRIHSIALEALGE